MAGVVDDDDHLEVAFLVWGCRGGRHLGGGGPGGEPESRLSESLRSRKRSKLNDATFNDPADAGRGQELNDRGYEHGWLDLLLPHETIDLDTESKLQVPHIVVVVRMLLVHDDGDMDV